MRVTVNCGLALILCAFTSAVLVSCEQNQVKNGCGYNIRDKVRTINSLSMGPYPPSQCSYRVFPFSSNVCQLRIDFQLFRMAPPDTYSKPYPHCGRDALIIPAINMEFCGFNSGQHVYVPFNVTSSMDSIELLFKIANREYEPLLGYVEWSLMITQLECSRDSIIDSPFISMPAFKSEPEKTEPTENGEEKPEERSSITYLGDNYLLAPMGCLQYYPEPSGVVMSFSYQSGVYTGLTSYAICFRRPSLESKLRLRVNDLRMNNGVGNHWDPDHMNGSVDHDCYAQFGTQGRSEDYLFVPESSFSNGRATRFCGRFGPGTTIISSPPGPLMMHFKSDDIYARGYEFGFHMHYLID